MPAAVSAWQQSEDDTTFWDSTGAQGGVTVVPGATVVTDSDVWQAAYFKFRSGTATDPVIQPVDCAFICMVT